ncbi:MAG: hypothetical protein DHS20C01_11870 [marine bacterium B5-7]|nr:MAG: hypothetical protein DHS20C01_11870 [marine bacterium B5-7]
MASEPEIKTREKLSLYYRDWCGACFVVKRAIKQLGLEVELRNVFANDIWYRQLVTARGRGTVPVLRRDLDDDTTDWMGESRDIVRYLEEYYRNDVEQKSA